MAWCLLQPCHPPFRVVGPGDRGSLLLQTGKETKMSSAACCGCSTMSFPSGWVTSDRLWEARKAPRLNEICPNDGVVYVRACITRVGLNFQPIRPSARRSLRGWLRPASFEFISTLKSTSVVLLPCCAAYLLPITSTKGLEPLI